MVTDIQEQATSLPNLVVKELKVRIEELGSQKAVADDLDIPQSMITEILKMRRPVSESVAEKLGFVRITFFVKKDNLARVVSILSAALGENEHFQKLLDKVLAK